MEEASKSARWGGWAMSGLALLFLAMDAIMKIVRAGPAVEGTTDLGYPAGSVTTIGWTLLVCIVLYAVPRLAPLGAILLTGYLGGAMAAQLRVESPLLTHMLFPFYVAVLVWGGLLLRQPALRALFVPGRQEADRSLLSPDGLSR